MTGLATHATLPKLAANSEFQEEYSVITREKGGGGEGEKGPSGGCWPIGKSAWRGFRAVRFHGPPTMHGVQC